MISKIRNYGDKYKAFFICKYLCLICSLLFCSCNKRSDNKASHPDSQTIEVEEDSLSYHDKIDIMAKDRITEFLKSDNVTVDTLWVTEETSDTLIDGLHIGTAYKRSLDESEYILYNSYSRDESGEGIEIKEIYYGMQGEIILSNNGGNSDTIVISRNDILFDLGGDPDFYTYGLWNFKFKHFENDSLVFGGAIMKPESDIGPEIGIRIKKELHPTDASLVVIDAPLDVWFEDDTTTIIRYPLKLRYKNKVTSPE